MDESLTILIKEKREQNYIGLESAKETEPQMQEKLNCCENIMSNLWHQIFKTKENVFPSKQTLKFDREVGNLTLSIIREDIGKMI